MVRRKRIAFIRPKARPFASTIVDGVIREQFPDHAVDVIDVSTLVRKRPVIVLVNSVASAFLYGIDIIKVSGALSDEHLLYFVKSNSSSEAGLRTEDIPFPFRFNPCSMGAFHAIYILFTPVIPTRKICSTMPTKTIANIETDT